MFTAKLSLICDQRKVTNRHYAGVILKLSNVISLRGIAWWLRAWALDSDAWPIPELAWETMPVPGGTHCKAVSVPRVTLTQGGEEIVNKHSRLPAPWWDDSEVNCTRVLRRSRQGWAFHGPQWWSCPHSQCLSSLPCLSSPGALPLCASCDGFWDPPRRTKCQDKFKCARNLLAEMPVYAKKGAAGVGREGPHTETQMCPWEGEEPGRRRAG